MDIMGNLYEQMRTGTITNGRNHLELYRQLAELGKILVHADRASFWRWDRAGHRLITAAATGTDPIEIDEHLGLVGRSLMEDRALVTNDPYHHPDFNSAVDKKTGYTTKSILVMPVSNCKGEVIGAFQAINCLNEARGFVLAEDCKRLSLAAIICGLSLESDLFLADSQTDKLTKLRNRMGFHDDYASVIKQLESREEDGFFVSLLIGDIDHFKRVNDTFGHNAGDAVLTHVARQMRSSVRDSDRLYRWGGEEFLVVLPGADLDQAAMVAERIRKRIEQNPCRYEEDEICVTISLGVAQLDRSLSAEKNVGIADKRLYLAKEGGRNRSVKSDQPGEPPV